MTLMQQLAKKTRERRPDPRPYTGPDKSSANGNRPLTFPTPYHGGKRRWADEILQAFGPERECVYVEPFSGSAAVLLANPRPFAREILCDTNPHISNVFRCLAWAPETTAFWADWPTTHQDLTARHTWLLRWAVDHVADIEADPDFHDPKAAGWWLWGKSNWIGTEFAVVRGLQLGGEPDMDDATRISTSRPQTMDTSGRGVAAQRKSLPATPDKRPLIGKGDSGGTGVQAQRTDMTTAPEKIPHVKQITAGRGVSAQRHGDILYGGGKGYQPPAPSDVPYMPEHGGGRGVNAQRKQAHPDSGGRDAALPQSPADVRIDNSRPCITDGMRGSGVSAMRQTPLPYAPDWIPGVSSTSGQGGVNVQSTAPTVPLDKIPGVWGHGGGSGVQPQRDDAGLPVAPQVPRPTGPVPLTGDRLLPWFQALAERLYRVIILNRGWQSGLTPTVLQQTRSARKPPVRVLIDPPYKGVGKLYGMSEDEAGALAVASWRWAAENGSREGWRIAYACREGDFDDEALALGWTCSKTNISANHSDSTQEVVWFSPHCLRPGQSRQVAPGEQGRMFETGE